MSERTGGCQCGAVRYRMLGEPLRVAVCHCSECQRHSGGAFGMSMILRKEQLVLESGALKRWERSAESGRSVVAAFCPECGTRIMTEPTFAVGIVNLKPGTLDDPSWVKPTLQVWTRSRQPWLTLPELEQHETQPV